MPPRCSTNTSIWCFEGLDTYAEVFLNEQQVLTADNMFRRWRVAAKPLLKAGPNTLRIVFHSPITSMIPKVKALPYILPSVSTANEGNEENVATAPYTRKAPYQYGWDWGPRYVTIGIWKPVYAGNMGHRSHRELSYPPTEDYAR